MVLTRDDFRRRIEYSICQQFAGEEEVRAFCRRARDAGVGVACFNPVNIPLAVDELGGSGVEISANIGFPFGSHHAEVKALETRRAVEEGATQIDMVINVGALRSGRDRVVDEEIRGVVQAAGGRIVKTIIETWVLFPRQIERACRIAEEAGAHMVKTTTGVRTQYLDMIRKGARGAEIEDIRLMRRVLGPSTRIKASGGIYTLDDALDLIRAGADHLGMSRGEEVVREFARRYGEKVEL
ncbi:MAG: deoxyribose-phosphate aldolase [Spirochaetota bacterium]